MNLNEKCNFVLKALYDKKVRFKIFNKLGLYKNMPDEEYIKLMFETETGQILDLENVKTFNEKLQWLKLNDRNELYTLLVDKYLVKDYVASKIGSQYVIPTLGVWENANDINFDLLPNKFVLKCNHNSGLGLCICKDKSKLSFRTVREELSKGLKQDYFLTGREWPYKNVPRRILAEELLCEEGQDELTDYKLMCFNGKVKCSFTCTERFSADGLKVTFYDNEWKRMPFERKYPSSKSIESKPICYDLMKKLAETLSKNIPFVRVDFYQVNGKVYFGEMTFYPGNGMEVFTPKEWDYKLGEWIELPK